MSAAAVLLALQLAVVTPGAAPELAPYARLARDPAATRALLHAANAGMRAGFGVARSPGDTAAIVDWPGSVRPLYVTLVRGRTTRACVGADVPAGGTLAAALGALGAQVVASDRRHPPLAPGELDSLQLVIAFAGDPRPEREPLALDPMHEGLKIETDRGAVAFLPGEARTVGWALREARRIGVLAGPDSEVRYYRFAVVTLRGPAERVPRTQE